MEKRGKTINILSRFSSFFDSNSTSLLYQFIDVFGYMLEQAETDLLKIMASHHVDKADNQDSQCFSTTQKGDLDKIFALYLEAVGGTSQLMQVNPKDDSYRERLKILIQILRRGGSTKQGIIDIAAANLGIIGSDEKSQTAKKQIKIEEYYPQITIIYESKLALGDEFEVNNPNPRFETPEVSITLSSPTPIRLVNPRLVNLETGQVVEYLGEVKTPQVRLNCLTEETIPLLPPGKSRWRLESLIMAANNQPYPVACFDSSTQSFDDAIFISTEAVVTLKIRLYKLTPGTFTVKIPWHIPGFTDKFDELDKSPRHQIPAIVNRVKAAGVLAVIAYEQRFQEQHQLTDSLFFARQLVLQEEQGQEIHFQLTSQQGYRIEHQISDTLITSGVFDCTYFDSDNRFG